MLKDYISRSDQETMMLGKKFGKELPDNSVVCFFGDLAAGKTTFIKGLVSAFDETQREHVNSPTFVYLNIYQVKKTIYHFDLYRLRDAGEFIAMGFDEMLYDDGICCIEWSERISSILPANRIKVAIDHISESVRQITIS